METFDSEQLEVDAPPDVYAQGAAFYTSLLKSRLFDEADEFAEWFLETFDLDLEN